MVRKQPILVDLHQLTKSSIMMAGKNNMLVVWLIFVIQIANQAFAQEKKDTTAKEADFMTQMIDYSRPGKNHQVLADLVGSWTFKGRHFDWVDSVTNKVALEFSGTIVRRSFAHGRFFVSEVTSDSTLEMPIQDGKMKVVKFQGMEIEGYDNVKKRFVRTTIGNHIGSGIYVPEGIFNPSTKTITFESETEMVPGVKGKTHELYLLLDHNHYKGEYYYEQNGKFRIGSEINFTRVKDK